MEAPDARVAVVWSAGPVPAGIAALVAVGDGQPSGDLVVHAERSGALALLATGSVAVAVHDSVAGAVAAAGELARAAVHVGEVDDAGIPSAAALVELEAVWRATPAGVVVTDLGRALGGRLAGVELVPAPGVATGGRHVQTWSVCPLAGPAAGLAFPDALAAHERPPFVGRTRELDLLDAVFERCARRERRLLAFRGEAGVGKSALVARWARQVQEQRGALVLHGGADEAGAPYAPVVAALRPAVRAGLASYEHVPALAGLLGEAGRGSEDLLPASAGEALRFRLFEGIADVIDAAAGRAPLVLVLDDLQWCDRASLLALRHALLRPEPARLLVVAAIRTGERRTAEAERLVGELAGLGAAERVNLGGLPEADVASLLVALGGQELDAVARRFSQALSGITAGNPLFVRELVRSLADSGALVRRDERWTSDLDLAALAIPETLKQVIGRRVASMGARTRAVLTAVAVLGGESDAAVIGGVTGDRVGVLTAIDEACDAGLLIGLPGGGVALSSGVLGQTLLDGLSSGERRALHAAAAGVLEATGGEPLTVARHLASAGEGYEAATLRHARRAAHEAAAVFAFDEAVAAVELALAAVPDGAERARLLLLLAQHHERAGNPREARRAAEAAAELARREGDGEVLARSALIVATEAIGFGAVATRDDGRSALVSEALAALSEDDSALRCRLLAVEAALNLYTGGEARTRPAVAAAAMAERLGEPRLLSLSLQALISGAGPSITMTEQLAVASQAEAAARRSGDTATLLAALWLRRNRLIVAGDLAGADRLVDEVALRAEEARDPYYGLRVSMHEAMRLLLAGRPAEAAELRAAVAARAEELGAEWSLVAWAGQTAMATLFDGEFGAIEALLADAAERYPGVPTFRLARMCALAMAGDRAGAAALLAGVAADDWAGLPRTDEWLLALWLVALTVFELGAVEEAASLAGRYAGGGRLVVADSGAWVCAGSLAWTLGLLAATAGDLAAADLHLQAAADQNRRIGAAGAEAVVLADRAVVAARVGAAGDAERLAAEAAAAGERLGVRLVARRLERLAGRGAPA